MTYDEISAPVVGALRCSLVSQCTWVACALGRRTFHIFCTFGPLLFLRFQKMMGSAWYCSSEDFWLQAVDLGLFCYFVVATPQQYHGQRSVC
ncbi:hypothetical protein Plhal304r1_c015g0055471 [Plasmopara halstedii]